MRFQVCLPGASSAIDAFFDDTGQWPMVHAAYVAGIGAEIGRMLETIPADDLVVQFDFAWEVVDLAIGDGRDFPFGPDETTERKRVRHEHSSPTSRGWSPRRCRWATTGATAPGAAGR